MEINAKAKLITFNDQSEAPTDCDSAENYWLLIGKTGIVVEPENKLGRVLVKFDESVIALGLHCHNKVPNSLFIKSTDLEIY